MIKKKNLLLRLNKSKIGENITWLIFDKIFILFVNLFVIVIIANHYGPETYGLFQYVVSIVAIIEVITLVLDGRIVKKQYDDYSSDVIVSSTTFSKIFLSLVALLIGVIFIPVVNEGFEFNILLILLLFNYILINLGFGIKNHFEFLLKSKKIVLASNFTLILSVSLQFLAINNNLSIIVIPGIMLIASFVQFIILFIQYIVIIRPKSYFNIDLRLVKMILKESFPLAVAGFAATVYSMVDTVMLGIILSNYEVGIYSIANKLIAVILIIISPITISIYPKMLKLFKQNRLKYNNLYNIITTISTCFIVLASIALLVAIPVFFKLFMNVDYMRSIPIFNIRLIGVLFAYNSILRVSHYAITGKTNIMMYSQICAMLVNILLNYYLINSVGLYGAAIATIIAQFISLYVFNVFFEEGKFVLNNQIRAFSPQNISLVLKNLISYNNKN